MIIDATDLIMGRLASYAAKNALLGEKVDIINSEKAIITGNKADILEGYLHKSNVRGTWAHGPFISKNPDRLLKRTIRGMLPYKKEKGKKALKKIKCYIGVPEEFKDKKIIKIKNADVSKISNLKYITLKEICLRLGAKL